MEPCNGEMIIIRSQTFKNRVKSKCMQREKHAIKLSIESEGRVFPIIIAIKDTPRDLGSRQSVQSTSLPKHLLSPHLCSVLHYK